MKPWEKCTKNMEYLGKQEKYLFDLNYSFSRANDKIQKGSIKRKQQQRMMVQALDRNKGKAGQWDKGRESEYKAPTCKKGHRLIARCQFKPGTEQDHQSQKTNITRRSKTISAMMSHIVMLLSWFFWQV